MCVSTITFLFVLFCFIFLFIFFRRLLHIINLSSTLLSSGRRQR